VDAREGGEKLGSVHSRPEVVARRGGSGGGHGWSGGAAGRDAGGSAPFMGDQRSTATSLGARARHYSVVR
jgi:hypothetical protein